MVIKLKDLLIESTGGDCYPVAGRLAINFIGDNKAKLVHGMVNGQGSLEGIRFGHAWVEYGNKVLDHSNGKKREVPKSVYYKLGKIKPEQNKYYTSEEAIKWMMKSKHWGPWQMSGDTVMAEEIPDDRREIGRKRIPIPKKILGKL
tara:strand:- start:1321 stop:1758 length:438 start_codon:yes stop_codon:yes gene_type:complete